MGRSPYALYVDKKVQQTTDVCFQDENLFLSPTSKNCLEILCINMSRPDSL